jgi:hypothetical protein
MPFSKSSFARRTSLAVLFVALSSASGAQARWGPAENCSLATHCYAFSYRSGGYYDSIAAEDNEVAVDADWESGSFYDQEEWVSWPSAPSPQNHGWVEAGISEGNGRDCCTAFPFYATLTQKYEYHEVLAPGPVTSGSGQYNYVEIFDTEHNGVYHVFWSGATNTTNWFEVARFGGGRPTLIGEVQGGLEVASNVNPYHAGRQEVALTNGGEWVPWSGAAWYKDRGVCIGSNRELGAAGDIEWTPGHNEC